MGINERVNDALVIGFQHGNVFMHVLLTEAEREHPVRNVKGSTVATQRGRWQEQGADSVDVIQAGINRLSIGVLQPERSRHHAQAVEQNGIAVQHDRLHTQVAQLLCRSGEAQQKDYEADIYKGSVQVSLHLC